MPVPFILAGAAAVAGVTGVAKGASSISKNSQAKKIEASAQKEYHSAEESLERQRKKTTNSLETLGALKVDVWGKDMNGFVKSFHSFKNVRIEGGPELNDRLRLQIENPDCMKNMEVATVKAAEIVQAGVASLGAGALAGIASYGGAMMFASASTGTAIAALSGAAATNATLAWFGGGALAVGGMGMAGGTLVLGGIVAGPVLAVAGLIMNAKANENLAEARRVQAEVQDAVEKMEMMSDFMKKVSAISDDYANFIVRFRLVFHRVMEDMTAIEKRERAKMIWNRKTSGMDTKIDFNALSASDQKKIHLAWLMAQALYSVLEAPILTQDGELETGAGDVLKDAESSYQTLVQEY